MTEKGVEKATVGKHIVIIVILVILLFGSLSFSIFVVISEEDGEGKVITTPEKEVEKKGGEGKTDQIAESREAIAKSKEAGSKEDDSLTRLLAEKQQLEEEKAALEKEKLTLKEKKSALEKQLIAEIKGRPVFNVDKESPFDHVKDSQVQVLPRKVEINLQDVTWWTIQDTNSMDPLLDIGSTALSIKPRREGSLHVGDVALYDSQMAKTVIIHRIIMINADQQGWYSNFKGDNLEEPDPENVRFPKIKGVLIGVIY